MGLRRDRQLPAPRQHALTIELDDRLMEAIEAYAYLHGCTPEAAAVGAIYHALVRPSARRSGEEPHHAGAAPTGGMR